MRRESSLAGLGALALGILTFVAFLVANPPGGNYKASDVATFLAKSVFWGFGVASVAAWLGGSAAAISPSLALAFSGGHLSTLSAPTAYTFSEAGWALMYGGGGSLFLGAALVTFALGTVTVPACVRWFTLVWTLVADRSRVGEPSAAPA